MNDIGVQQYAYRSRLYEFVEISAVHCRLGKDNSNYKTSRSAYEIVGCEITNLKTIISLWFHYNRA